MNSRSCEWDSSEAYLREAAIWRVCVIRSLLSQVFRIPYLRPCPGIYVGTSLIDLPLGTEVHKSGVFIHTECVTRGPVEDIPGPSIGHEPPLQEHNPSGDKDSRCQVAPRAEMRCQCRLTPTYATACSPHSATRDTARGT